MTCRQGASSSPPGPDEHAEAMAAAATDKMMHVMMVLLFILTVSPGSCLNFSHKLNICRAQIQYQFGTTCAYETQRCVFISILYALNCIHFV